MRSSGLGCSSRYARRRQRRVEGGCMIRVRRKRGLMKRARRLVRRRVRIQSEYITKAGFSNMIVINHNLIS